MYLIRFILVINSSRCLVLLILMKLIPVKHQWVCLFSCKGSPMTLVWGVVLKGSYMFHWKGDPKKWGNGTPLDTTGHAKYVSEVK